MPNRIPKTNRIKVGFVCEGNEEYKYLTRLNELGVFSKLYDVRLINACGNGNIFARYQYNFTTEQFDVLLVFCDTEKKPYEQYEDIKRKINEFHDIDNITDNILIFANPCTMQIVVKHWCDEVLKSNAKKVNAPLIEKYTGVKNYKGREDQIEEVMKYIFEDNYLDMKERASRMSKDDYVIGSSNIYEFITKLESDNINWIDEINKKL